MGEEQRARKELREAYKNEAKLRKYKHNMQTRYDKRDTLRVFKAVGSYPYKFLFMKTNDKILYDYKRKLKKEI